MKLGKRTLLKMPPNRQLEYTADDLRWATPQLVADYRAQRLKCKTIADIGCGIGFQAFSFAKTCQKVYAVDLDKDKLSRAQRNAARLGLKNIKFICGDALDPKVINQLEKVDIIFCDPQRPTQEEKRSLRNISPNVQELLSAYLPVTTEIAIEFPPQIKEVPFDCEREYLSVDGQLNRLTIYFNKLKQVERSAAILPGGYRLLSDSNRLTLTKSDRLWTYLYEVDPAVVRAGLLAELSQQVAASLYLQEKSAFFTSQEIIKTPFFKNSFKVILEIPFETKEIARALQREHFGKAVIRYAVEPQWYWQERKKLELRLTGEKTAYLFKINDKAVIAEKLALD